MEAKTINKTTCLSQLASELYRIFDELRARELDVPVAEALFNGAGKIIKAEALIHSIEQLERGRSRLPPAQKAGETRALELDA